MKRIVNLFAPEEYYSSHETTRHKQKISSKRATSFVARLFQHLAGTYSVLSQISNETEKFLQAEERKKRVRQKEKKETIFFQENRISILEYEIKVPEHILVKPFLNLKP
ncbi:MAG TPA: hypothetical protein VGN63_22935 [Flavisolibacter sp.]|jgi:hypothetical protein|nr:hypothetical protein [Flavisolibacter sp.]